MKPARLALAALGPWLAGCESLPPVSGSVPANVVFALPPREGFTSPLERPLKPACAALTFQGAGVRLTASARRQLQKLAAAWPADKPRYLLAGYAPAGLPDDHARSLSERRAQEARRALIELGVEAGALQTAGFGHDQAGGGPTSGVVVVYAQ